jgi:hypothetical protein
MGNQVLNQEERMNLAKKHKKLFEHYSITKTAYKLDNQFFYSAFYEGKFNSNKKAEAVVSVDTDDKKTLMRAFHPLCYYGLCITNLKKIGGERAHLDMRVFHDIKSYLENPVKANVLTEKNQFVYERALKNINNTIALQDDMKQLYHDAMAHHKKVLEKGFFTGDELEQLAGYLPYIEIIQYNEALPRYTYRADFDVIYKNRNHADIKPYDTFSDDKVLRELTSDYSGKGLEKSLKYLSDNKDISHWSKEEHYQWLIDKQRKNADVRIEEFKKRLRYP